ncbi:Crp/Fnr family transcriptional regulator [Mucilaginibacter sp. 21P]|uniref:Crp/Fnr family transcriptional regulator n=1 Tax=Mucilaginibacter sp. 21P TaxID=2778902 RepID=UPI001C59B1C5|nr:Crp/Fnr family transcriptional regulator [Mucilaginibacter sp. 21P]QXV63750.1 Crp/Fnr family transcriptional regulator [Mucilaginibacter sp. 21P]
MIDLNNPDALDDLYQMLTFIAPITGAMWRRIGEFSISTTLPRKTVLLREGETAKNIYFICKGAARGYYTDEQGREHNTWFMHEKNVMLSITSFYKQCPARESIELLQTSDLILMTWTQVQTLYAEFPESNYHGRLVAEKYLMLAEERLILLRTKNPYERYRLLLATHPLILQYANLGHIASYLCMTPETLSRIRAKRRS